MTINIVNSPIDQKKIESHLNVFFKKHNVDGGEVTISFVDEKTMREIGKKYYKKDNRLHNVFSFVESEAKGFVKTSSLGEIVVCYAAIGNEKDTLELIEHSALHLLGIHHEE